MSNQELIVKIKGEVVESNLDYYKVEVMKFIASINSDLKTDEDFVQAEADIKDLKGKEGAINEKLDEAMKQAEEINLLMTGGGELRESVRQKRLELEKLVKVEKQHRKSELVKEYYNSARDHYKTVMESSDDFKTAKPTIGNANEFDFEASIKGLKTFDSMQNRLTEHLESVTGAIDTEAEKIAVAAQTIDEVEDEHKSLFQDRRALLLMAPDTLAATIRERVANAKAAELERKERERLAAEKAEQERVAAEQALQQSAEQTPNPTPEPQQPPETPDAVQPTPSVTGGASSEVNESFQIVIDLTCSRERAREIAKQIDQFVMNIKEVSRVTPHEVK